MDWKWCSNLSTRNVLVWPEPAFQPVTTTTYWPGWRWDSCAMSSDCLTRWSVSAVQSVSGSSSMCKANTPRHRLSWRAVWAQRVHAIMGQRGRNAAIIIAERPVKVNTMIAPASQRSEVSTAANAIQTEIYTCRGTCKCTLYVKFTMKIYSNILAQ